MEDKNKEVQLKEEEAEKVSGGHFEPMYGTIGPDSYESDQKKDSVADPMRAISNADAFKK